MNSFIFSLGILAISISPLFSDPIPVLTTNSSQSHILYTKTTDFQPDELPLAKEIGESLIQSLALYGSAAGLAAPQIGISRSVFIYSNNRDPKNLEIIINPSFSPIGTETLEGWEGCFSVELRLVKVSM